VAVHSLSIYRTLRLGRKEILTSVCAGAVNSDRKLPSTETSGRVHKHRQIPYSLASNSAPNAAGGCDRANARARTAWRGEGCSRQSSAAGAHHSDQALQPGLHVLQRVRRFSRKPGPRRNVPEDRSGLGNGHGCHHDQRRRARCCIRSSTDHRAHARPRNPHGIITNGYLRRPSASTAKPRRARSILQPQASTMRLPDEVSKKSLKVLDQEILSCWVPSTPLFQVNINSVLGSGVKNPEERWGGAPSREAGLHQHRGILHDGQGQLKPLRHARDGNLRRDHGDGKPVVSRLNGFQPNIAKGKTEANGDAAPARRFNLNICEDGLVHWCSQQRGYPGIPVEKYTARRPPPRYFTKKHCAPRCTVSCVPAESPSWTIGGPANR